MPDLHIPTLAFLTVVFAFSCFFVLSVVPFLYTNTQGLRPFSLSFLCFALGFLLLGMRGDIPEYLSKVTANSLICLGGQLLCWGMIKFRGIRCHFLKISNVLLTVSILLFAFFTYNSPSVNGRIFVITGFFIVIFSLFLFGLAFRVDKPDRKVDVITAFPMTVMLVYFYVRIVVTIRTPEIENFMLTGTIQQLSFVIFIFFIVFTTFSMILMITSDLETKLRLISIKDELTGAYNRRAMDEVLNKEIDRSLRYSAPFSLLMLDLDYFKEVNDNYGHQIGDYVLRELGRLLTSNLRMQDSVLRYGGEEFLILLPETSTQYATRTANKLRKIIQDSVLYTHPEIQLTASIGVASIQQNDTAKTMIERADAALYQAKASGRNKVICA